MCHVNKMHRKKSKIPMKTIFKIKVIVFEKAIEFEKAIIMCYEK